MKIRIINLLEISFGIAFVLAYFLTKANVVDLKTVAILSTTLLGILYFPLGFYTLKSPNFNITYSIVYGLLFGISSVAIIFSLMKLDISIFLFFLMLAIYLIAAISQVVSTEYIYGIGVRINFRYDDGIKIRYLIFFAFMIYALVTSNS